MLSATHSFTRGTLTHAHGRNTHSATLYHTMHTQHTVPTRVHVTPHCAHSHVHTHRPDTHAHSTFSREEHTRIRTHTHARSHHTHTHTHTREPVNRAPRSIVQRARHTVFSAAGLTGLRLLWQLLCHPEGGSQRATWQISKVLGHLAGSGNHSSS